MIFSSVFIFMMMRSVVTGSRRVVDRFAIAISNTEMISDIIRKLSLYLVKNAAYFLRFIIRYSLLLSSIVA